MKYFTRNMFNQWPPGISDGLSQKCKNCGVYPVWDYTVTDKFWSKVVPKEWRQDVICFDCFVLLCRQAKLDYELPGEITHLQYTSKGFTIWFSPDFVFWYKEQWLSQQEEGDTQENFWKKMRKHWSK